MGLFDFLRKKPSYPVERRQPEESPVLQAHTAKRRKRGSTSRQLILQGQSPTRKEK